MTLSAGARLGPYEIVSPLGAGGMGEVYRARDTRLERTVAVKVLPQRLSDDTERRQRFEREARAVSSLNHPHICVLYDIGHQDGTDYIVMEYLEGETLSSRLGKSPLSLVQALRCGIEVADALDKAHKNGVVHRDLKPANIMLTKSGAKLLDFGLAKRHARGGDSISDSSGLLTQTQDKALTGEGTLLGTLQYMAPEQLEGKEADARTDIFVLGSVLYEMVTGKKAFEGKSSASLIAAILTSEPRPITSLQPMTPPALDRLVKACLAKEPDERWQSAHDVVAELRWIGEGAAGGAVVPGPRTRTWERFAWMAACGVLLLALALRWLSPRPQVPEAGSARVSIVPPEGTLVDSIALSPDGRHLAFAGSGPDGRTLLWIRPLDSDTAQAFAGTEGALYPFWSPDARFLGFFADGKLKKVDVSGGHIDALCAVSQARGGTWNRGGVIVFAPNTGSGLYRISSSGGAVEPLTRPDSSKRQSSHRWPHFLPDGRHVLYYARSPEPAQEGIYLASLDGGQATRLVAASSNAAYATPGYLLFARGGRLMGVVLDTRALRAVGEPFVVADGVVVDKGLWRTEFSVSDNGTLAYPTAASRNVRMAWLDPSGRQLSVVGPFDTAINVSLSRDDRRAAVSWGGPLKEESRDIYVHDFSRGTSSRLTFDRANDLAPIWSPDGSDILFASDRLGPYDLYRKRSTGGGEDELLVKSDQPKFPCDWSLDGRFIVYESVDPKTKIDLWVLPMRGERRPAAFLRTDADEQQGIFSPDGRWLAYTSNETGRNEVYIKSFPASGGKWQVSTRGGVLPRWRRDGKELFYVGLDRKITAVAVKTNGMPEIGTSHELFEVRGLELFNYRSPYDVTADGRRFLMSVRSVGAAASPISVVLNWTAGLKR